MPAMPNTSDAPAIKGDDTTNITRRRSRRTRQSADCAIIARWRQEVLGRYEEPSPIHVCLTRCEEEEDKVPVGASGCYCCMAADTCRIPGHKEANQIYREKKQNEMYQRVPTLPKYYYGPVITPEERNTLSGLVAASQVGSESESSNQGSKEIENSQAEVENEWKKLGFPEFETEDPVQF